MHSRTVGCLQTLSSYAQTTHSVRTYIRTATLEASAPKARTRTRTHATHIHRQTGRRTDKREANQQFMAMVRITVFSDKLI